MNDMLPTLIVAGGIGHFLVLLASALVPFKLNWQHELKSLSRLHRQMYWVYGGYIVLSILAFGLISILCPQELTSGTPLARAVSLFIAVFWGIRLALQAVFDAKAHLKTWWLTGGYHGLTVLFLCFTLLYGWSALQW